MKAKKEQINGRVPPQLKRRIRSDRKTLRAELDVIFYTAFEDFFTRHCVSEREELYRKCPWWPKPKEAI